MGSIETIPAAIQSQNDSISGEYDPDFEAEWAATQSYMEGKSYIHAPAKIRIIVIGAAASSLSFAREINLGRIENAELVLYEKNNGVGGTWLENKYAGCACDIPSHNYQYTWAPNPGWSEYYSGAPEIRQYFEDVAKKYDLEKYIKLDHEVISAQWIEKVAKWEVKVRDNVNGKEFTDYGEFLINGGGIINNWQWPKINGLHSFKGVLMHSAAWDSDYDFTGKNVVIIGNGSSGVQITAALGKLVNTMTVIARSPCWITPGFAPKFAGADGLNFRYTDEQKKQFRENPKAYLDYRKEIEAELHVRFPMMIKGSPLQRAARQFCTKQMKESLKTKPEFAKKLIPTFDVGCRRRAHFEDNADIYHGPTPGNGFLETLNQDNVKVSFGTPQGITEKGLVTHDGQLIEADAIICATGFDLSYKPRFPIIGRHKIDLADQLEPDAKAYMSLAVPNFPNYLVYLGPATTAAQGPIIPTIEQLTIYFTKVINKLQREGYAAFDAKQSRVSELYQQHQDFIAHTAWSSHCRSTFKNGTANGRVNLIHGGSRLHHYDMLKNPRWEDFDWTLKNGHGTFDYLGNGFSKLDGARENSTWYMDNPEMEPLKSGSLSSL